MPLGTVAIRTADVEDIPAIRAIALATWPVAYGDILSPRQLAYMLDLMYSTMTLRRQMDEGHRFLVAEDNDRVLGFAGMEHHLRGGRHTRLHKLYVLPEAQGTGSGRKLLSEVEKAARVAGDDVVELNVNKFNPALTFYLHHGYVQVRAEVIDIGEGFVMDDFVLERSVGRARP